MNLKQRIDILVSLGDEIAKKPDWLSVAVDRAFAENRWFDPASSWQALDAIASQFLDREILTSWAYSYPVLEDITNKKIVGLVLAGNIPLVGFHDLLSCFVAGHVARAKVSTKDAVLIKALIHWMIQQDADVSQHIEWAERLAGFDAVIATGSNNSSTYFKQYFGAYPHIIRKNRSAVAVLRGDETDEDLVALGVDIFNYYGLGCRNVSKIYVPAGYNFDRMLTILHDHYKEVINHNKYKNNFDYNYALFLLNKVDFLMSGSLILIESEDITSRIATLHFAYYEDIADVAKELIARAEEVQCVVSGSPLTHSDMVSTVMFGQAQQPKITDYADGVDTMDFLTSLS